MSTIRNTCKNRKSKSRLNIRQISIKLKTFMISKDTKRGKLNIENKKIFKKNKKYFKSTTNLKIFKMQNLKTI